MIEVNGVVGKEAPINLSEYSTVIAALRGKNLSFSEIAEWLDQRLGGRTVNRGAVYRTYLGWQGTERQRQEESDSNFTTKRMSDDEALEAMISQSSMRVFTLAKEYLAKFGNEGFLAEILERAHAAAVEEINNDAVTREANEVAKSKKPGRHDVRS